MVLEIRPITDDEYITAYQVCGKAFGEDSNEENWQAERKWWEADRSLGVWDGGALVATAGAYSFDLTLPGGTTTPVAGVTWVGVLPTHRRQGVLRSMMDRQLDDVAERGELIAVLTASEAVIYGRFGYGVATQKARAELLAARGSFHVAPEVGGRFRLLDSDGARKVIPAIHDTWRRTRAGVLSRTDRYWDFWAVDQKDWRRGASARFVAVHEHEGGSADGYVAYRVKEAYAPERPGNTAVVDDVVAVDPSVEAALFRYVLDIDLIWDLQLEQRPVDDPLRWWLADSRQYRTVRVRDWLWVRLLDPAAALATRRYDVEGRLALGVSDPFRPANDGVYVVEGGPEGATCQRVVGVEPDVQLPIDSLGAVYLGGVRLSTLAAAGRVSGDREALAAADRFLTTTPDPFCDTGF
ncbi:MAG: GNAT family N-acetyltransferase [Acidimicrobiales bacterium]